MVYDIGFRV